MNSMKEMITVDEFSKIAQITTSHARQLLREGKIEAKKVGKEWRILRDSAYRYLNINTDSRLVEEQMKISQLEGQLELYKSKFNVLKDMLRTLENLIETTK